MQLSEHFADTELGVAGCDARLVANARYLCTEILEPLRGKFGPILVHDGYRDCSHNVRVGGKPDSFHLYEDGRAAADLSAKFATVQQVFDWLRHESDLGFDKVILELNEAGVAACVHVQLDCQNAPRRLAYVGQTGAGEKYDPVDVR